MIRTASARRLGALAVLLLGVFTGPSRVLAEGEGLDISGVDTSAAPEVSVEFNAGFELTGGTLSPGQVELLENGVPLEFALQEVPASGLEVVLLIDTSGSMNEGNAIESAKSAAISFLSSLPAEVSVGVVSFADSPSLVSPLTTDRTLLATTIGALTASGETSMYDAIQFAQTLFSGGTDDRQFVLLSDGGDTVSSSTIDEAVVVASQIRTNVIELVSSEANTAALQQLSSAGNGTISLASDPAALDGLYREIANSLTSRYVMSFTAAAGGEVTYTVRVTTAEGPVEASATATLPARAVETTTTPVPATTVLPATTAVPADPDPGVSDGKGDDGAVSTRVWLLIGAGSLFCALLLLGLLAIPERRRRSAASMLPVERPKRHEDAAPQGIGARIAALAEGALDRGGKRSGLSAALEAAAINLRPGEFLVLAFSAGVVVAMVLLSAMGPFGFLLGVVLTPFLARMIVEARSDKRRKAFGEQLPDMLQMLVSSLRSGFGLPQALDAVANQVAEPGRGEMQRVLLEVRIGRDPTEALQSMAERMKSRDFEWVVAAIHINREVGGELAVILENVGETVRERQQLARQVRTLTAEGRLSAYVLTALPLLLVVVLSLTSPGYFDPMSEPPGPMLIALGAVLLAAGWLWMRRLIRAQL